MPRLTRSQQKHLDSIEHNLGLILRELNGGQVVVTMRSRGASRAEYHNAHTGEWLAPIRPASLAFADNIRSSIASMRAEAEPKAAGQ